MESKILTVQSSEGSLFPVMYDVLINTAPIDQLVKMSNNPTHVNLKKNAKEVSLFIDQLHFSVFSLFFWVPFGLFWFFYDWSG